MKRSFTRFTVAVVLAGCAGFTTSSVPAAAPQAPPAPTPANPTAQQPGATGRVQRDFTIHARHLLYVAVPGSLERPIYPNGDGLVVLDADNNYAFVKRIHLWDYAASMSPEDLSGVEHAVSLGAGTLGRDRSRDGQDGLDHNPGRQVL